VGLGDLKKRKGHFSGGNFYYWSLCWTLLQQVTPLFSKIVYVYLFSIVTTFQQLLELFSISSDVINLMISGIATLLSAVLLRVCRNKVFGRN
jgi:hypothetical protein